jgi:arsenate reductase (glutaredoxin)
MANKVTIYHNPRCSKSRETLQLLNDAKANVEIVEYLKSPLSATKLKGLIKLLGIDAEELVRKGEPIYKEKFKGKSLSEAKWIEAMVDNPKLIERPIVSTGTKAVLGRPPQNVNKLI